MGIMKKRWLTAISLIFVLSVATACFQQVGDEAGGQAVSVVIASDTPIPLPTDTATQFVAQDLPISNNPTETDTPTPTETATDTSTPVAVAQAGGTATPDDFSLRATQLVIDATNTAVAPLTETAAVLIGFTDTPTPTALPVDTGTTVTLSGADCVHEVRAGETMYSYSRYYGIPVMDIATRNNVVNANIISIGQRLIIPGCGTTGAFPPPTSTPAPTLTPYAFNTTGTGGTNLAGDANPGQGGGLAVSSCVTQYTVQQYDTLFQISISYGVAVQSIANANGIINPERINMGDVLCIPSA